MSLFRLPTLPSVASLESSIIESEWSESILDHKDFKLFDISVELFYQLKNQISQGLLKHKIELPVEVFQMNMSDAILKSDQSFVFRNLLSESFGQVLNQIKSPLDTNKEAVLIGDEATLACVFPSLAQVGFKKFTILTDRMLPVNEQVRHIMRHFFGVQVNVLPIQTKVNYQEVAAALVVDIDFLNKPEFLNHLIYFNFLMPGSLVVDLRSHLSPTLTVEAKRMDYHVVESDQIYKSRYQPYL